MDLKKELISRLKNLLSLIEEQKLAETERLKAENALFSPELLPTHLKDFDDEHMEAFIEEKIGKKPIAPGGIIVVLLPVYLIQKAQYDAAIANYNNIRPLAESAYREMYREQRDNLMHQDEIEGEKKKLEAQERLAAAEDRLKKAFASVNADDTVNSTLKQEEIVKNIILYLEEARADSLKEAINLYYEEKRKDEEAKKAEEHRREMIELEEERVRAAQAAEEYAEMQYQEALQAKFYAQEAAESAEAARDAVNNSLYD